MTTKHIQRLQLTVLPRHIETIQSLKWELDTNSQVIMRLLDAIHLGTIDVSAILCPDFSKRHTPNTHNTSNTVDPRTTNTSSTQTADTSNAPNITRTATPTEEFDPSRVTPTRHSFNTAVSPEWQGILDSTDD